MMKHCIIIFGFLFSSALSWAMDPSVEGVDQIKLAIRSANSHYDGLPAWKIYYKGDLKAGEYVNLQMTPVEAFTTVSGSEPREFLVSLRNPKALLTELGFLKELGVLVHVTDNVQGTGSARCVIYVTFRASGTGSLIPLEKIFHEDRRRMDLSIFPVASAEFLGFDQDKAYFRMVSGEPESVTVTLRVNDGGKWYTCTSTLASCPAPTSEVFVPPSTPTPLLVPQVLTTLKVYQFKQTIQKVYGLFAHASGEGRTHGEAYDQAKRTAELSLSNQCNVQLAEDLKVFHWAFGRPLCGDEISGLNDAQARLLSPVILSPHYPTDNIHFTHGLAENTRYTCPRCWTTEVTSQAQCSYHLPLWTEEERSITTDRFDFEELKGLCSHWSVRCIDQITGQVWIPSFYEER